MPVGWVEAHGFAVLVGLLFLAVAARDGRRFWHVFAVAVHLLLGTANIVFWHGFTEFGMLPAGIAATVAHGAFVLSHGIALSVSRRRPEGPRRSRGDEQLIVGAGGRPIRSRVAATCPILLPAGACCGRILSRPHAP